jgi:hypothetical protein
VVAEVRRVVVVSGGHVILRNGLDETKESGVGAGGMGVPSPKEASDNESEAVLVATEVVAAVFVGDVLGYGFAIGPRE